MGLEERMVEFAIDYYIVRHERPHALRDVLRRVAAMDTAQRAQDVDGRPTILHEFRAARNGRHEGEVHRVESDAIPCLETPEGARRPIRPRADEGLGHSTAFVLAPLDDRVGVLAIQSGLHCLRPGAVTKYLIRHGMAANEFAAEAVVRDDVINRLIRYPYVADLKVRFAAPTAVHDPHDSVSLFDTGSLSEQFGAANVEVILKAGRGRLLDAGPVKKFLAFVANHSERFLKVVATRRPARREGKRVLPDPDPDLGTEPLDLLGARIRDRANVEPDGNRELPLGPRLTAIHGALDDHVDRLRQIYVLDG